MQRTIRKTSTAQDAINNFTFYQLAADELADLETLQEFTHEQEAQHIFDFDNEH